MFKKEKDLSPCADCYNLCGYELYYKGKRIKDEYTMKSTITVNLNNLTGEEREQLLKLVEKSNIEKSKVWKPNEGDTYYYINSIGAVTKTTYNSSKFVGDIKHYKIGNCFKAREDAEFAAEKQKLITEIKRYIAKNDPEELDWKDENQRKLSIYYDYENRKFGLNENRVVKNMNTIYFSDKLNWRKMIEDIGEDRIKKYLFGVK